MTITSVRCPVLHAHVTRVTDFEGAVARVICAEYEEPTGICRLKRAGTEGGPLGRLIARADEELPGERSALCNLRVN
jgi:hypothetical protein